MLAHATHLVQPNDKSVNKSFKQNLDDELARMASNDLVVQNHDLAYLSYRQVGVYPFNRQIVLQVIRKYQVHLDEKIGEKHKLIEDQIARKEASSSIKFGTKMTKVLTSSISP